MYAIARINTFDEEMLHESAAELDAFQELHAGQPGYSGSLVIDLGGGRRLLVNLWESEQHAVAGLAVLASEVTHVLAPLMAAPSELIGTGPVVTDLSVNR